MPLHGLGARDDQPGQQLVRGGRHGAVALEFHDVRYADADQDAGYEQRDQQLPERETVLAAKVHGAGLYGCPRQRLVSTDIRSAPADERWVGGLRYDNLAHTSGLPSGSTWSTRGRPV